MMNHVRAALVLLLIKLRYVGISSASGQDWNISQQDVNATDIFLNSTLQNGTIACDADKHSNVSMVEGKVTAKISKRKCLQNLSPSFYGKHNFVVSASLAVCLGIWSVGANSLPLAAIIKQEQLHMPFYILMANLAASDVMTGMGFVFSGSSVLSYLDTETDPSIALTRLRFASIFLSGLSSAYGLMVLTAERYWFIVHGLTYVTNVNNNKCKVVIIIVWFWSLLLVMPPIFGLHCAEPSDGCLPIGGGLPYSYVVVFLVFISIPMVAIILLNMGVLWCVWKHVDAIGVQEAAVGAPPSTSRMFVITIVLITVVFLVGWLPMFVRMALITADIDALAQVFIFIILNSAINPIIYGFRLKEIRHGVARLFVIRSENVICAAN